MSIDPCREWLGIPAVDLVSAHAVLGVFPGETDPAVIAAAAQERLRVLRGISPGPFSKAHAALIARVEEARDAMLATVPAAAQRSSPPARMPPPLPSRPILTEAGNEGPTLAAPAIVIRDRTRRPKRSVAGSGFAAIALIAAAAAAATAYVAWPGPGSGASRRVASRETAARPKEAGVAIPQPPSAAVASDRSAQPQPRAPEPPRETTRVTPPPAEMPPQPRPVEANPETVTPAPAPRIGEVERLLRDAYAALRSHDHDAAAQAIQAAAKAAGDDGDLGTRVGRWDLLVDYARQLTGQLEKAIASANQGREYEIGDRIVSIIEIGPETFSYKEAGRIRRVPRASMPKDIEQAVLRQWFDADGRAANHILLGVQLLLDEKPSLPAVRDEWETALAGEPATASILPLLDDPILASAEE
ncbi:MAG: hypothetical protein ACR2IT_01440 [Pirellulales bacterium]